MKLQKNLRIEITHDILAAKVYDRIDAAEKMRLKVTQMLHDRYDYHKETGEMLSKRELAYIEPYVKQLDLNQEQEDFLADSFKKVKYKENQRKILLFGSSTILITILSILLISNYSQKRKAKQELAIRLGQIELLEKTDGKEALAMAKETYTIAHTLDLRLEQAISKYYVALLTLRENKYGTGIVDALADATISERLIQAADNDEWLIQINGLLGFLYDRNSRIDSARYYLNRAIRFTENASMPDEKLAYLKIPILLNLANTYQDTDSTKAVKFFSESIQSIQTTEIAEDDPLLSVIWGDIGTFYWRKHDYIKSDSAYIRSKDYALASNDTSRLVRAYQQIGNLRFRQFTNTGNEKYFRESLNYFRQCLPLQKSDLYYIYDRIGHVFQRKAFNADKEEEVYLMVDSAIVNYKAAMEEAIKNGARLDVFETSSRTMQRLCEWSARVHGYSTCTELFEGSSESDLVIASYRVALDTMQNEIMVLNNKLRKDSSLSTNDVGLSKTVYLLGVTLSAAIVIIFLFLNYSRRLKGRIGLLQKQLSEVADDR